MASILIRNISQLVQVDPVLNRLVAKGREMSLLPIIENGYLLINDGNIIDFGNMDHCPERADEIIDAKDRIVMPSWCDSHTHLVYAASREEEFADRIRGVSYEEIAQRGGGILNSARKLGAMSEDALYEQAWHRLQELRSTGTGAIEIKSGYGLSTDSELKMLRVIRRLREASDMTIKATFLGAHAVPMMYRDNRVFYINMIINEMLPRIADEGLADYIDVFCEKIAFSADETSQILEAGARAGLKPKIHSNQFNSMGGIEAAIRHNAVSVDHLEVLNDAEIAALKASNTIATLLPTAPFFLNDSHTPPARDMINAGLPIALASDYNPGTSPSGRMSFVVSLACIRLRMTPEEAINAATLNGAYAMELSHTLGSIQRGKQANIFITKPIPSIAYLPYSFGSDLVDRVIINGR